METSTGRQLFHLPRSMKKLREKSPQKPHFKSGRVCRDDKYQSRLQSNSSVWQQIQ